MAQFREGAAMNTASQIAAMLGFLLALVSLRSLSRPAARPIRVPARRR